MKIVELIFIETAKVMKALSDPKRLRIVDMLSQGEFCAHNIQKAFQISQPTLSHDMRVLKEAGITLERREGKNIFYTLNYESLGALVDRLKTVFAAEDTFLNDDRDDENN